MRALNRHLTEDELVAAITQALGDQPRKLVVGIGDDSAGWKAARSHVSLITTDALIDGVHFHLAFTTPRALGHKAVAVGLSDIAAMGGAPTLAVVALGITNAIDEQWARDFYAGMAKLARRHACTIAGGDIVRAPALMVSVTVVGDVRTSGLRLRSGAKPGDVACTTGPLGLAAAGLRLADDRSIELTRSSMDLLRSAYDTPTPRVAEGRFLGSSRFTHAMMDISDGLSLDIARMARASGVDVCLDLAALKPHPVLAEFLSKEHLSKTRRSEEHPSKHSSNEHRSKEDRSKDHCSNGPLGPLNAMELMLHGGDDYELLAAVDPRAYPHLARRFKSRFKRELTQAGRFEKGSGNVWTLENGKRREHIPRGYDHLSSLNAKPDL